MTDAPQGDHQFLVTVSGCTREQAETVMAERLNADEDYGFAYAVDWKRQSISLTGTFANVYEDGYEVTRNLTIEVSQPPPMDQDDEFQDWAYDQVFPHTGTGRTEGDAGYFVEITACEDRPELVGVEFEWGT